MCSSFQWRIVPLSPSKHFHVTFPQLREHLKVKPTMCFHLYAHVNFCPVLKKGESSLYSVVQPGLSKNCGRNISKLEIA